MVYAMSWQALARVRLWQEATRSLNKADFLNTIITQLNVLQLLLLNAI